VRLSYIRCAVSLCAIVLAVGSVLPIGMGAAEAKTRLPGYLEKRTRPLVQFLLGFCEWHQSLALITWGQSCQGGFVNARPVSLTVYVKHMNVSYVIVWCVHGRPAGDWPLRQTHLFCCPTHTHLYRYLSPPTENLLLACLALTHPSQPEQDRNLCARASDRTSVYSVA
jgi:hypothetical protein